MPRILIDCDAGLGAVPTGYRTSDLDLAADSHPRSFRCLCGAVHTWVVEAAWAEERATLAGEPRGAIAGP